MDHVSRFNMLETNNIAWLTWFETGIEHGFLVSVPIFQILVNASLIWNVVALHWFLLEFKSVYVCIKR